MGDIKTATAGCTLKSCCECAIQFDNQHCGIYAGDWDCYKDFAEVFDPLIQEYHGISADAKHTSDMDVTRSRSTSTPRCPSTPPVSGLDVPLMASVCPLASPRSRGWVLRAC